MNWIKTAVGLIGGASSIYSILGTIAVVGGIGWYLVDDIHYKPIRVAKQETKQCYADKNKTAVIKNELLNKAGKIISDLSQELYDLNQSVKTSLSESAIELSDCKTEAEKLQWRINHEKINTSDEFFYITLPF